MWFMGSQENHIPTLKLFQYFLFKHVKGLGGKSYIYKTWKREDGRKYYIT